MATIRETNNGLSMQRVKNGRCVVWVSTVTPLLMDDYSKGRARRRLTNQKLDSRAWEME